MPIVIERHAPKTLGRSRKVYVVASEPVIQGSVTVSAQVRTLADLAFFLEYVDALGAGDECSVWWVGDVLHAEVASQSGAYVIDCGDHPSREVKRDVVVSLHSHDSSGAVSTDIVEERESVDARGAFGGVDSSLVSAPVPEAGSVDVYAGSPGLPRSDSRYAEEDAFAIYDWPSRDRARLRARGIVDSVLRYGDESRPE